MYGEVPPDTIISIEPSDDVSSVGRVKLTEADNIMGSVIVAVSSKVLLSASVTVIVYCPIAREAAVTVDDIVCVPSLQLYEYESTEPLLTETVADPLSNPWQLTFVISDILMPSLSSFVNDKSTTSEANKLL